MIPLIDLFSYVTLLTQRTFRLWCTTADPVVSIACRRSIATGGGRKVIHEGVVGLHARTLEPSPHAVGRIGEGVPDHRSP